MFRAEQVYNQYTMGDPITDDDLDFGIDFFQKLANDLVQLGPVFTLAQMRAQQVYTTLESYQRARSARTKSKKGQS